MTPEVAALVERLRLEPHPEGGYFRELYRSARTVRTDDDRPARAAVTTIFYLLAVGQHSRWHRVRSDEIWHFYAGDPLELHVASASLDRVRSARLSGVGSDTAFVHAVQAGEWQAARPAGAFALVGCTVAPGFDFADFAFLANDPARAHAAKLPPELQELI